MESVLGVNVLQDINLPTPNNLPYYTPTQLGKKLATKPSAIKVNKKLREWGFLLEEHESGRKRDVLTPKGAIGGGRYFDTGKKRSDGTIVQQIKWHPPIVESLAPEFGGVR
ncbi:hypothetical protein BWK56_04470 [Candidatus Liberibacter asiaticus]|nr:hypothetical protein [Candidatus Liberibacter asiaticus]OMH86713.1 hypothetical protein BWK56_04470 [Candidatus Liberibacter asiaticus]